MADIQANIGIGVDTSQALASIRQLQREISVFHTLMAKGGANAAAKSMAMQQGLINTINETGRFSASMTRISSSTESFTNALEKNKLSMGQYFRYAGGASKSFGKMFSREFNTINRVATERVKDLQTQYISMGRDANGALQSIKVRPLALDMDNLGTKVQLAAQKQQIFNQLMKQGTTNLLNFGKNTQWAGRQLMVGFTIPLTIFGATAAREFQKLEEQAVRFRRVYGDMFTTDADTEKALANVRQLAEEFTKYGVAVEKTVGLAAKVAQMGNVGEDLTAQVTQATRLAVLGGLEQEQALDTTISLTNAFGVAAEDLAGKIAFLNAAENQTILSIEDFNEAIPKAGSVVQQLGGDVEDLAFFLTAMREGGINASQGANALKTSLARLVAPTEVAKKEMAAFGIDIVGIVEQNAGNLRQTVLALGQELDGLDALNRARAIEQLFGKFQFARMSTMFQNISKEGGQASKILELTTNSMEELAIVAERELKAVEDSPAFRLKKQMEELKASLAPIGEEFIKAVGPLIEFGTKLLKSFNNLGDGGKQFIVILTAVAGVVAPALLMGFGLIANGVANLLKFFQFLGNSFGMLSGKSTLLGGQTEYMTQQQIEAAAVAASLGQSHSNLTQIFTSEASAISNLVTQYRAAIQAQRQLSIGQTAAGVARMPMGPRPKGFANGGIIRGPGTGTSDSIPAMVSNGEAIIPAKQTQKYHGLIEAIIGNNVPGYATAKLPEPSANAMQIAKGLSSSASAADSVAKHVEKEIQKRARHFGTTLEQAASDIAEAVAPLKGSVNKVKELTDSAEFSGIRSQRVSEVEQQNQFAHFGGGTSVSTGRAAEMAPGRSILQTMAKVDPEGSLAAKHSWGMDLSRQANREMDVSPDQIAAAAARGETPGRRADSLVKEMSDRSEGEAFESLKEGLGRGGADTNDPEVQATAAEYHQKIVSLLSEKLSDNADAMVVDTDEQLAMMTPEQQANAISMESVERDAAQGYEGTKFGAARQAALDRPKELRLRVNEDVMAKAQDALDRGDISQEEYQSLDAIRSRGGSKDIQLSKTAELPGMESLEAEAQSMGADTGQGVLDGFSERMQIASPSKRMFDLGANAADSLADGFQQGMADETGKPPLPGNLAAPKPPVQPEAAQPGKFGKLFSSAKDKINESKIAQKAADYLGGQDLTDKITLQPGMSDAEREAQRTAKAINQDLFDKGLITEDMQATPLGQTQGVTPVRVVDGQLDIGDNSIDQLADASPAANEAAERDELRRREVKDSRVAQEEATEATQGLAKSQEQQTKEDKAARKEQKRQNRQSRAGKALGALGTMTMVAGMATQVEGKVGEVAQKALPALAGLSAVAPLLMALPLPLAALVAVVGLGVGAFFLYNKTIKDATEKANRLGKALGTGSEALQKYADATGKARPSEIRDKQREEMRSPFKIQPGETPFGQSFVGSDEGQELLASVREMIDFKGMDAAQAMLTQQLQAALIEGSLTQEQARGIALALGQEMDNLNFSMDVNAKLVDIFGPNGEDLESDPLSYAIELNAELTDQTLSSGENLSALTEQYSGLEGFQNTAADIGERIISEGEKVEPWLKENVPSWARYLSIGIIDIGAKTTAAVKGAWGGGLEGATQIAEEAGRNAALITGTMQAFANNLDAIDVRYDKLINSAELEGNLDLVNQLTEEKTQKQVDYLEDYKARVDSISAQFAGFDPGVQTDILENIDESILKKFEDDPVQKALAETALEGLDAQNLLPDQEFLIKAQVDAGNVSLSTLSALANGESVTSTYFVEAVANVGGKDADLAMQIAQGFGDNVEAKQSFMFDVATENPTEAKETIETFNTINKMRGVMGDDSEVLMRATVSLKEDDPAAYDDLNNDLDYLNSLDGKEITTTMISEHIGDDVASIVAENQDYFDSLPPEQKIDYVIALRSMATAYTDPEFKEIVHGWALANNGAIGGMTKDQIFGANVSRYMAHMADLATTGTGVASETEADPGPGSSGSGSEPQVDSLIRKLRDLRDATVSMKKGWEGMQETLNSIFAGGTTQMNMFNGLEKQIRSLGVGEGLIAQIVGMDPDEYEKRKNELFEFDGLGNIIAAKAGLENMNSAFNAVAIGEYVNGQEQFIQKTKDQMSAIRILTSYGMSLADAYDAVQDAALAAAIAQGASAEQVQEILKVTRLAKELEEDLEEQRERSRISESVRKTNEEFSNQVDVLKKLSKAQGEYSDEQVKAIMGDKDLQKIFLDPSIDSKALEAALQNAAEKANLEVQIAIAEGREDELFGQYLTEVNDYFSKEEAVIGVNFEMDTADESKIIEDAQRQIAAIQYQLDDYNAELEQISWSEEDINEKYDKRVEALDEIADANKKISDQQKAQLDIADALSKGDIAAAARATAELRSQQASDAQESQKEQLDRAREAELKQLTGASGMTREQLEDAITSLERQVFQLEETALEPAQERVRLAEITRDLAIEQLELNGMTRDEFDQIAASTNLAALNMEDMVKSAEKLVAMGEFIRTGEKPANWEELFPKPKAAPPPPRPAPAKSSGPELARKSEWTFAAGANAGKTVAQVAQAQGYAQWQDFYNSNPGGIDRAIIPKIVGMAMGGLIRRSRSGPPLQMAMGGRVKKYANGGMIIPKRMAMGGYSMGSDTVPAILTPGEFVVRRPAVSAFGLDNLEKINRGTYNDGSVYNYNLAVNVKSNSDPNRIARAVITQIKQIDNQRIRSNKI